MFFLLTQTPSLSLSWKNSFSVWSFNHLNFSCFPLHSTRPQSQQALASLDQFKRDFRLYKWLVKMHQAAYNLTRLNWDDEKNLWENTKLIFFILKIEPQQRGKERVARNTRSFHWFFPTCCCCQIVTLFSHTQLHCNLARRVSFTSWRFSVFFSCSINFYVFLLRTMLKIYTRIHIKQKTLSRHKILIFLIFLHFFCVLLEIKVFQSHTVKNKKKIHNIFSKAQCFILHNIIQHKHIHIEHLYTHNTSTDQHKTST